MSTFKKISPNEIPRNPIDMISNEWMLVSSEKEGRVNTMTASWGGVGFLWGKNIAFIFIRPQRHTKKFIDSSDTFSLTFFDKKYREDLAYFGSVSGSEEDKVAKIGYKVLHEDGVPYFEEANLSIICKNVYKQKLDPNGFSDESLIKEWYPNSDFHEIYVAEIMDVLVKED
ncbi:flavin reductase [Metaclostridioides mangenotii]|uniref:flavin reductase n=1 Tax=Metaclostridioides mangenotii TaxID=1540 RepID=UPI00047FDFB1|nr:flavin reductase [Clostridioides mangenotii]